MRWQALPERVWGVYVGPDQRVWYRIDPPKGGGWMLELAKKSIEAEFNRPSPQIVAARPILFERGGRVWFTIGFEESLFGYDGKKWVEHQLNNPNGIMPTTRRVLATRPVTRPATRPLTRPTTRPATRPTTRTSVPGTTTRQPARPFLLLTGSLPNHGTWERGSANLQVGDTLVFPTNLGVLSYDTRTERWEHLQMSGITMPLRPPSGPRVFLDDDGKGVTAVMLKTNDQAVWRWRDGRWTRTPAPWPRNLGGQVSVVVTRDGWVSTGPCGRPTRSGNSFCPPHTSAATTRRPAHVWLLPSQGQRAGEVGYED